VCVGVHVCVHVACVCARSVCSVLCVHLSSLENLTVRRTPTAFEGCHCEECSKIRVGCS